jgi:hypothetical protein
MTRHVTTAGQDLVTEGADLPSDGIDQVDPRTVTIDEHMTIRPDDEVSRADRPGRSRRDSHPPPRA